eukprot:SRR837773.16325.p1 GENE.SRR837773.16325~~SRR837773.16325.p1  ORF type:complete len:289 (-),score=124.87 SRR837773.16325:142-948(-)
MAFAGAARVLLALAAVSVPAFALNDKASNRAAFSATAAAVAEERQQAAVEAQLADFLEKAHHLRGRTAAAQIRALAKQLESKQCKYEDETLAANTDVAIKHFSDCVKHVYGLAQATLASAEERGRRNQAYGTDAEASLSQMNTAVENINKLHRSIVTEHKVASDHLAHQVTMIKRDVSVIDETNEDHKAGKGWETKASQAKAATGQGFYDEELVAATGGRVPSKSAMTQLEEEAKPKPSEKAEELAHLKEELASVTAKVAALEKEQAK